MAQIPTFNRANALVLNEDANRWAFMVQPGDDPINPPEPDDTRVTPVHALHCYVLTAGVWVPLTPF